MTEQKPIQSALDDADKIAQRLEAALAVAKVAREIVPYEFRQAVRESLRRPGAGEYRATGYTEWRKGMRARVADAREKNARRLKAYSTGTTVLGPTLSVQKFLAHKEYRILLQDVITEVQAGGSSVAVEGFNNATGTAGAWSETVIKQVANRQHTRQTFSLLHVAITETYTQRALDFLPEDAIDGLALDLLLRIESAIHGNIVANMFGVSAAFPATTYAGTVPAATWADVVALVINHEMEYGVHESPQVEYPVDLVILPRRYNTLFPMSLKTTFGQRLYSDYAEAFAEDGVITAVHDIPSPPNTALVARSGLFYFFVAGEVQVYNDRVVDAANDQNLYRMTVEIPIGVGFQPRVNTSALQGYVMACNLVADRNTINV